MSENFAHLHVHSDYTLGKGASKIKAIVDAAKKAKIAAMALTDDSNMYGAMEFSNEAVKAGIQPIIGVKLWLDLGESKRGSIILLAQNEVGYENICRILAHAHRPHEGTLGNEGLVQYEDINDNVEHVIALTGGQDGCLMTLIKKEMFDEAKELLNWLRYHFCDRLYVEVVRFGNENQEEIDFENKLLDITYSAPEIVCKDEVSRHIVPLIASSEVWYSTKDRHASFEILNAVVSRSATGKGNVSVQDGEVVPTSDRRCHVRTPLEMKQLYQDLPEAYENAINIAQRCAFKIEKRNPILPTFTTEQGRSESEEMRFQAHNGLEERLNHLQIPDEQRQQYLDRLNFELDVIERMDFPGYFLIVSDFITWAKSQGIPVGPGRGSGAGSLVAYSLKITDLDPLRFGLLFERFLNPDRVSMPDFDVDFCQDRREDVIQYVREKYGSDFVSMIATFQEIKSRTAIKDVGRVMSSDEHGTYHYNEMDLLTKIIPKNGQEPKKLADAMTDDSDKQFADLVNSDPKNKLLVEKAMLIEGLNRSTGTHAAGVIISGRPLHSLVPVGWDVKVGTPVCQFNMKHSEDSGLVKFDFLGLKTLSVINECLDNIKTTTGQEIDLSLVSLDDAETFKMLAEGHSNGVFQFESDGMKKWFKALRPSRFEDLIALAALYRPGPMDMIPHYVDCKNGKATPQYPEPVARTKPFLEETFGIMVYQEQVMLVAQVVAGYSLGGADLLRRAMGKKIPEEMAAQRDMFVKGATANGTPEVTAGELFDTIAKFAGYGFNKSHAAAYALIAYHTAWLKRHYPAQFLAALLSYETDDPEKMSKVKEDMDTFGIKMLLPDINRSKARFRPEPFGDGLGIRFGLNAIKGISSNLEILDNAQGEGDFKDLIDFYQRAGKQFNKGQLEKLAEAGAFDTLGIKNRYSAADILAHLGKGGRKALDNQNDLFGGTLPLAVPPGVGDKEEWGNKTDREFNAVGFYFGDHPLDLYESRFRKVNVKRKASLKNYMIEKEKAYLKTKRLAGMVEDVIRRPDRNGDPSITVKIAEKRDIFYARYYGEGDHIESVRVKLENAKTNRRPVIIIADVSIRMDRDDDDLAIWGRDVIDADEMLANERTGNVRITIDAEEVKPSLEAQRAIRAAKEAVRNGQQNSSYVDEVTRSFHMSAIERKKASLIELLSRHRNDVVERAIEIIIAAKTYEDIVNTKLEGRYLMDQSLENSIKATDGVISVEEAV